MKKFKNGIKGGNMKRILYWIVFLLFLSFLLYQMLDTEEYQSKKKPIEDAPFQIYFIDVGQGDCILIQSHGEYSLVDSGNYLDGEKLVSYFQELGIEKFQYVIGTHVHEDHIGGMNRILKSFKIGTYYMPNTPTEYNSYLSIMDTLPKRNIPYVVPKIGDIFYLNDTTLEVLSIGEDQENMNNTSIVLKVRYQDTTYLLMADAEKEVELELLNKDIQSDVLKVGHHGSNYASSAQFLQKVKPKYAIISVGLENEYGHPKKGTLDKLEYLNTEIHRTDIEGTIILSSDGKNISIRTEKTDTNREEKKNY